MKYKENFFCYLFFQIIFLDYAFKSSFFTFKLNLRFYLLKYIIKYYYNSDPESAILSKF